MSRIPRTRTLRPRGRCASPLLLLLALVVASGAPAVPGLSAQEEAPDTAPYGLIVEPDRTLDFEVDEGTWLSLDVSPDGRTIVFDLMGDLYLLPVEGGRAERITQGMAWDAWPRWSPDGERIAFVSDRTGSDNLWTVRPDGSGLRVITSETDFALSVPEWTPDGDYLVARRFGPYPGPVDYLRNVPLWIYHVDGGSGTKLFPQGEEKTTNTGPSFSPDGRFLYTASHAGGFQGEELGLYQVVRFDRETGRSETLTSRYGGGLSPIVSPDGRWLVYATRMDAATALRIRDLENETEEWLVAEVQRDNQEGYAPNDVFPGYAFTPDSRAVVFTHDGKIRRVEVATKEVGDIPFTARVEQRVADRFHVPYRIEDGPMEVKQLLGTRPSPDGARVVFSAVGKLWTAPWEDGAVPERLTGSDLREYQPAWSPDGRWVAYVTWSDENGGALWKVPADGGAPVRLTEAPGFYTVPTWTPDGREVVYGWAPMRAGLASSLFPGGGVGELRRVGADGGGQRTVATEGDMPTVVEGPDGPRVWYVTSDFSNPASGRASTVVKSVRLDGYGTRTHATLPTAGFGAMEVVPSPDGRHLLVLDRENALVAALPEVGGDGLTLNLDAPSVPVQHITREGANDVAWADGGETVVWSFVNHAFRVGLDDVMAADSVGDWSAERVSFRLSVPRAAPEGSLLLEGARIVTLAGPDNDEVIPEGDILITDNRIAAVGRSGTLDVPADARRMDVSGTTIIPGLIDVHAHPRVGREIAQDQEWSIAANLAYGVTTTRNPSGTMGSFPWAELVESGEMVGSRIYATGPPVTFTNDPLRSVDDARAIVRKYREQGAHSIKQYLQPRRIQRQRILQAAIEEGIIITNEGAGDLKMDATMALDGFTAFEHTVPIVHLYEDYVQLFARTGITYTPAAIASYGAPPSEDYWRGRWDMHDDAKLRRFTPHEELDRTARRPPLITDEDFVFDEQAADAAAILRAGGSIGLGSHGNRQGLGAQWEMFNFAMGGMTPMEVLQVSTIVGAESIGFSRDLGTLEPGKLADLLVLDANPLDDIRNVSEIRYVVVNGFVREGATLDMVWPREEAYPEPYWLEEDRALERLRGR